LPRGRVGKLVDVDPKTGLMIVDFAGIYEVLTPDNFKETYREPIKKGLPTEEWGFNPPPKEPDILRGMEPKLPIETKQEPIKPEGWIKQLVNAYRNPPSVSNVKNIIGGYTGGLQMIDHELSQFAKRVNDMFTRDAQEAITRYMQAGGDEKVLQAQAAASKEYKHHYERALKLTPEEKAHADIFRKRLDYVWLQAHDAGILDDYVENYVRGEWEKPNETGEKLVNFVASGGFTTNAHEAMHKVFQNYFEGEQLGFKPKDSRIGYQMVVAERSLRQAVEARKAFNAMLSAKEKDGRPTVAVGGAGSILSKEDVAGRESYFIKPNTTGKETGDYRFIAHPAMRKWKWIDSDENGKPIFLQGNMWIHPDAYSKIYALLGKSAIREYTVPKNIPIIGGTHPGAAALRAGAFVKASILIGPFHQFHVGEHAVFHEVNPFTAPEIDFKKRPILKDLVEHGLQIVSHHAIQDFGEGLAGGGLWHRVPILGDGLIMYQEYLFQDYIPRLKAAMAEHAVTRAEGYYKKELASGKLTRGQMLDNVAKQANAAFGEMNYKYMGRNPTLQDTFRLIGLAPDFLEARLKFFGQAARPYGKEQFMALLRAALIMSAVAQAINVLFGDDRKAHWDRPFSVIINGREYTPRSVIGDMMHLFTGPRSFVYHRLNPLTVKPVIGIASGKDQYGRETDMQDTIESTLKSYIPIPAQGLVKDQGDTLLMSILNSTLQSIGVSNYPYKTAAQKKALENIRAKIPVGKRSEDQIAKSKLRTSLRDDYHAYHDSTKIVKAIWRGDLTEAEGEKIIEDAGLLPIERYAKNLTVYEIADIIKVAKDEEKNVLFRIFDEKIDRKYQRASGKEEQDLIKLNQEVQKLR